MRCSADTLDKSKKKIKFLNLHSRFIYLQKPFLFSRLQIKYFLWKFEPLTLGLLPTPGVFWISHIPSVKPLMRTPLLPYFTLLPTNGTMFFGGRWPLEGRDKVWVQSGTDIITQKLCVLTFGGSRRRRRGRASCSRSLTYTPKQEMSLELSKYTSTQPVICVSWCLCVVTLAGHGGKPFILAKTRSPGLKCSPVFPGILLPQLADGTL